MSGFICVSLCHRDVTSLKHNKRTFSHTLSQTHTRRRMHIQLHWGQYACLSLSFCISSARTHIHMHTHTHTCYEGPNHSRGSFAEKITTTHCNALQSTATVILQYTVIHYNTFNEGSDDSRSSFAEEITAIHCNTLQHTNTLQQTTTHSLQHIQ